MAGMRISGHFIKRNKPSPPKKTDNVHLHRALFIGPKSYQCISLSDSQSVTESMLVVRLKLIHGFLTGICQSWCMDSLKYMDLSKLFYGFLALSPNKTKPKSLAKVSKVLNESKYSMPLGLCAFGNVNKGASLSPTHFNQFVINMHSGLSFMGLHGVSKNGTNK